MYKQMIEQTNKQAIEIHSNKGECFTSFGVWCWCIAKQIAAAMHKRFYLEYSIFFNSAWQ